MTRRFPCCVHCAMWSRALRRIHSVTPWNGHSVPCAADWCDQGKRPLPEVAA